MNIADTLHDKTVSELPLDRFVAVGLDTSVKETVGVMNDAERSCAFVLQGDALVGIFTQRDVLTRVLGDPSVCDRPVETVMTPSPHTVPPTASVAEGMAVMVAEWVRSVPVVSEDGGVIGNFSFYTVMRLVSDLLSERASRTERELSAQHGLMFVDFTGLQMTSTVTMTPDESVEVAVHRMDARGVGVVPVVDERQHVVGTLSEYDLQTKVACSRSELGRIPVGEVMESSPVMISVRSAVAEAVVTMADHACSHVALVGESGRLVGMASFRQVADYFETSLAALR